MLRDVAAIDLHGAVDAFYRPEDIELTSRAPDETAGDGLAAHVGRILRTRPLARITLDCDPPITALMLHKDVDRLRLTDGGPVAVNLPPGGLRIFPAGV